MINKNLIHIKVSRKFTKKFPYNKISPPDITYKSYKTYKIYKTHKNYLNNFVGIRIFI